MECCLYFPLPQIAWQDAMKTILSNTVSQTNELPYTQGSIFDITI